MLHIKNLEVAFHTDHGSVSAVKNVSLEVKQGEIVAIVGESGSGKSVTALSVLGLLPGNRARLSGEIWFSPDERPPRNLLELSAHEMRKLRGNRIALIFQEPMTSLNPVFTCGRQVMEAIQIHRQMPAEAAKKQVIRLFEQVKLPDPPSIFARYPHQLSGGQKQRVMIAMAMSCNPSLLIADEPTTALDVTVQKSIILLIRELQQQFNMGVIFITHDLGLVAEIATKVIVMYKGNIVEEAPVDKIFRAPAHPYTKSLLACRPVLHRKGERLPVVSDFMTLDENGGIIEKTVKPAPVHQQEHAVPTASPEALVKVSRLQVRFINKTSLFGSPLAYTNAVDDVSFEVYKGETLGLVGESGCGKTTLGRSLLRLIEPSGGNISFRGTELTGCSRETLRNLRRDMQIIFQDPYSALNPRITIGNAILEPLMVHGIFKKRSAAKEKVIALLEKVDLKAGYYNRYPHELSGGQRQRVVIARALVLHPSFIICDESVSSLDVSVQAQVLNLLNDLKKEFGFTAIFISHDLSVVRYISDRIMVTYRGKIVESGMAEQVYSHPQTDYTRNLIKSIPGIIS